MNTVIICPSLAVRNTLIRAIAAAGGMKPALKSSSESAQRAHYAPEASNYIINTASARMHEVLGPHNTAISIPVENPKFAAAAARRVFVDAGLEAEVFADIEPEFPSGFLAFVKVPALGGTVLLFGPSAEKLKAMEPKVLAGMPKKEVWTETDAANPA